MADLIVRTPGRWRTPLRRGELPAQRPFCLPFLLVLEGLEHRHHDLVHVLVEELAGPEEDGGADEAERSRARNAMRRFSSKAAESAPTMNGAAAMPKITETRLKAPKPAPRRWAGMASVRPARRPGMAMVTMNSPSHCRARVGPATDQSTSEVPAGDRNRYDPVKRRCRRTGRWPAGPGDRPACGVRSDRRPGRRRARRARRRSARRPKIASPMPSSKWRWRS